MYLLCKVDNNVNNYVIVSMASIFKGIFKKRTMDNKNIKGPRDGSRVNVNEDYELRYWTERFNASADELREIVMKVGTSVLAVFSRCIYRQVYTSAIF